MGVRKFYVDDKEELIYALLKDESLGAVRDILFLGRQPEWRLVFPAGEIFSRQRYFRTKRQLQNALERELDMDGAVALKFTNKIWDFTANHEVKMLAVVEDKEGVYQRLDDYSFNTDERERDESLPRWYNDK